MVIAIVAAVAMLLAARLFWWKQPSDNDRIREHALSVARTVATAPLDDENAVLAALKSGADVAALGNASPLSQDQRALLFAECARFLWAFFGESTPDAYMAWREGRGYSLRDRASVLAEYPVEESYRYDHDAELPAGDSRDLFRQFFEWRRTCCSGSLRVTGLATEPKGIIIRSTSLTPANPRPGQPLKGELDIWVMGRMMCCRNWWRSPVSKEQMIEGGGVTNACVGVIAEWADGTRRPIIMEWIWSPGRSQWFLDSLCYGNVPTSARGVEY